MQCRVHLHLHFGCCSPCLLCCSEEMRQQGGKFQLLDKLLVKLHKKGHRVLVFSQVSSSLAQAAQPLRLRAAREAAFRCWCTPGTSLAAGNSACSFLLSGSCLVHGHRCEGRGNALALQPWAFIAPQKHSDAHAAYLPKLAQTAKSMVLAACHQMRLDLSDPASAYPVNLLTLRITKMLNLLDSYLDHGEHHCDHFT